MSTADAGATAASRTWRVVRLAATYGFVARVVGALTASTSELRRTSTPVNDATTTSTTYAPVCRNTFARRELVDVRVWTTTVAGSDADADGMTEIPRDAPARAWFARGLAETERDSTISIPEGQALRVIRENATLRLIAAVSRSGRTIDPEEETFDERNVLLASMDLTVRRERKVIKRRKLLESGEEESMEEEEEGTVMQAYFKPNATLTLVDDFNAYRPETIPNVLAEKMRFADAERSGYYPTLYFNEFWMINSYLQPLNETTAKSLKLNFEYATLSQVKWQFQTSMEKTWETHRRFGVSSERDSDDLKKIFLEGNPYLLAVTTVVSLLHTIFDFLAFKNDISFWKNRKSMEGLSSRSVVVNAVCQVVIFMYLCDNETSWTILISSGVGTAIEIWKVTRALDVSFEKGRLRLKDKASSVKSETAKHDADAVRYLSYVLYPCVLGYAVYSLRSHEHKSWWSFVLGTAVSGVYSFGFIAMCPQLYINYKLKSVAAMPWRQMGYKFLNTIIDDLFAFVVKMPTLHRLAVFRDDVIFLAFLYQRRLYRVDPKRANEFGYVADVSDDRTEAVVPTEDAERDRETPDESKKDR